jgi:hypothetical protein
MLQQLSQHAIWARVLRGFHIERFATSSICLSACLPACLHAGVWSQANRDKSVSPRDGMHGPVKNVNKGFFIKCLPRDELLLIDTN